VLGEAAAALAVAAELVAKAQVEQGVVVAAEGVEAARAARS
jgi:hypothetical protein